MGSALSYDPSVCGRCDGAGIIHSWCGKRGQGGLTGPCPRCNPATKQFLTDLVRQTWSDKRFTKGEDHA